MPSDDQHDIYRSIVKNCTPCADIAVVDLAVLLPDARAESDTLRHA